MNDASKHMKAFRAAGDGDLVDIVRADADEARRRAAATELLTRYRDAVYLWCYRYTRDRERALDLTQDVLASAWQALGRFEGRSKFSSWLFSVTRHRCIDASRRVDILADGEMAEEIEDRAPGADRLIDGEDGEGLMQLMRSVLDEEEQTAIWLRCMERMSVDQVTEILGLKSASGARAVLQRARRKLRAALDERERE